MLVPQVAFPQRLTGTLIGTVTDEQGGALPGALVTVRSRALIGGPITLPTNEKGQLRFQALPPGPYLLEVEMPGFAPYREENITLGVGATIERTVVLPLQGLAEVVVVEAEGSRIEARGSGFETRFDQEYIRAIPGRRVSMFDFIRAAAGVSPTLPSGPVGAFSAGIAVSAFGSNVNENAFLLDGTNFTCPCTGGAIAEPGIDVIQEVQVQSVGASAEFGNILGAVFNVVTKQGSNVFQYDTSYYGQPAGLTSQPVRRRVPNGSQPESGYVRGRYRDFTTNVGGPFVRDRLWFFAGYQYLRDYDSQPGTDPKFPRAYEQDKVLGKLTWQIAPSLRVLSSFHNEFWVNPERPTLVTPFETTLRVNGSVPTTTFAHVTHTPPSNTLWDARVGRFALSQDNAPSSGNRTTPNRFDRATGVSSGGPQSFGELTLIRTTAKATMTHYRPGLLAADHEWKLGGQLERGEHHSFSVIPTGTRFVDNNGQPFQAISRTPSTPAGQFITAGAFLSESMTLANRLTVNAGVRFDHSRAMSQDLDARDVQGRETGGIVEGLGTLYTWNVWSPRLGITMKLTSNGRTMLRASYGRFHQGVLTAELAPIHPGQTPTTTTAFDLATGGYTRLVSVIDPKINLRLDPSTRGPRTDEYSVGVDREMGRRLSATIAYVRKHGADFIGWTDTGGLYREETRTLPDGRSVPVLVLANSPADRRFLLTNPDGYSLSYKGMVLALEKRQSDGWQAFASYTLSKTHGLLPSSGGTASDPQAGSTFGGRFTFGRDPNSLTNARGRLPNDRPHMFRAAGSAEVPRTGFLAAANLQHFRGKPWAASTQILLPQGDQRVLLEPRGTRRLSSQTLLDLRLSRTIALGGIGRIELLVDVLNALNRATEEGLATDNLYSPNFGQPTVFVDPRRVMLSARLNLGR
jgi:hypothetical protein